MFEGKEVKVVLANAGAGKTHKIIEEIAKELEYRRPEEIAFVTFTKKGVEEGLRRVCNKLRLEPSDLPYFKTLHSLTFHALGLKANQMFGRLDQRKFNKEYSYKLNRVEVSTMRVEPSKDTVYLDYYDLERSGALTSKQMAENNIELGYYRQLVHNYEEFKSSYCLVDFFDCLIKFAQAGSSLPCKLVYVDECQDVSMLQWVVIDKAFQQAEKIMLVGDDKQSLYQYSGARPDILIDFAKKYPVERLSVSHRLPRKVFELANAITNFIGEKTEQQSVFKEGNKEGNITQLNSVDRIVNFMNIETIAKETSKAQWYILARNNCFLHKAKSLLEENLIPYWTADGFFMGGDILKRIIDYENFRLEGYKNEKRKEDFMLKFGLTDFSKPFTETSLFTEGRKWVYHAYIELYGLDKLKQMCNWFPQVVVSSIHHVKGGEAENVAIMLDMTNKTKKNMYEDIDEALRVLYVGVTRTRNNLFLISSKQEQGFDKIIQTIKEENNLIW